MKPGQETFLSGRPPAPALPRRRPWAYRDKKNTPRRRDLVHGHPQSEDETRRRIVFPLSRCFSRVQCYFSISTVVDDLIKAFDLVISCRRHNYVITHDRCRVRKRRTCCVVS